MILIPWICTFNIFRISIVIVGSTIHWIPDTSKPPVIWETHILFMEKTHSNLFRALYPSESFDMRTLLQSLCPMAIEKASIIDILFVPYSKLGNIMHWIHRILDELETTY